MTDPILSITATVTRVELTLGPLSIEVDGTYRITTLAPGGRTWSRQTVASRYTHGETKIGSVLAHGSLRMGVRAYATSASGLEAAVANLVNAFSQGYYTLGVTIDGVVHSWSCWEADIDLVNGAYDKFALGRHQQEYGFTIPRHPVALSGAL